MLLKFQNVEPENFDDFGIDLCPAPEGSLDSDLDISKLNCTSGGKKDKAVPRYGRLMGGLSQIYIFKLHMKNYSCS